MKTTLGKPSGSICLLTSIRISHLKDTDFKPSSCSDPVHVHVHMHQCSQKALSCDVPGCRKITRRISMHEHYINATESHQQLQSGEVQRLRQASIRMMYLHFYSSETKCFFYTFFVFFKDKRLFTVFIIGVESHSISISLFPISFNPFIEDPILIYLVLRPPILSLF